MWAYIIDVLIAETIPKNKGNLDNETEGILINTFLQSWRPRTRAHTSIKLDKGLIKMMRTGEKKQCQPRSNQGIREGEERSAGVVPPEIRRPTIETTPTKYSKMYEKEP